MKLVVLISNGSIFCFNVMFIRFFRAAPRRAPARAASPTPRHTQPVPTQAHPPAPVAAAPQQPSLFGQMAATAGGVAVGSAIVCISALIPLEEIALENFNHH